MKRNYLKECKYCIYNFEDANVITLANTGLLSEAQQPKLINCADGADWVEQYSDVLACTPSAGVYYIGVWNKAGTRLHLRHVTRTRKTMANDAKAIRRFGGPMDVLPDNRYEW